MIKYKTNLNCNLNEFHNWNAVHICIYNMSNAIIYTDYFNTE